MKKPKKFILIAFIVILIGCAALWFLFREGEKDNPIEDYRESSQKVFLEKAFSKV